MRTALFNYLFAKKHGGDFILRIEDTDTKREIEGSVDYLKKSLEWLSINPNEGFGIGGDHGPYKQSERIDIYKEYAEKLIESGHAYYAFDTPSELDKMRADLKASGVKNSGYSGSVRSRMKNSLFMPMDEVKSRLESGDNYVIRFNMPRNEEVRFKDEVRGWVVFDTSKLDDKIIWKSSNGLPTYHLANVVDDHLMEITHVIRGEEWVSSTPLHVLLYKAFDWEHPTFVHLPLILGPDGKKLGKRNKYGIPVFAHDWSYTDLEGEVVSIKGFSDAGYDSEALVNFMGLLGWSPGDDKEIMTLDEMCDLFSLDRINKSGAQFDKKKLDSFNSTYLRSKSRDYILSAMNFPHDFTADNNKLDMIAEMATERAVFAKDLEDSLNYIYERPRSKVEVANLKNVNEFIKIMDVFVDVVDNYEESDWTPSNIRESLDSIANSTDTKLGKSMPMLRFALAGGVSGQQLPDIMYVIGNEETKVRIESLLNKVKQLA